MPNQNAVKEFVHFYENFDLTSKKPFSKVYADQVTFKDPFHEIHGADSLFKYFKRLMKQTKNCRFVIKEVIETDNSAVIFWDMSFFHPVIDRKKDIIVTGNSHLKLDEKVFYHRDYFDSSALIYRHLPIMGNLIRFIEKRF